MNKKGKIVIGISIGDINGIGIEVMLKALSDRQGAGKGLILGICVAFIGLIVDNLIRTYAEKRKKELGFN